MFDPNLCFDLALLKPLQFPSFRCPPSCQLLRLTRQVWSSTRSLRRATSTEPSRSANSHPAHLLTAGVVGEALHALSPALHPILTLVSLRAVQHVHAFRFRLPYLMTLSPASPFRLQRIRAATDRTGVLGRVETLRAKCPCCLATGLLAAGAGLQLHALGATLTCQSCFHASDVSAEQLGRCWEEQQRHDRLLIQMGEPVPKD